MKKIQIFIVLMMSIFCSFNAGAENVTSTIKYIKVSTNGAVYVYLNATHPNPAGCAWSSLSLDSEEPRFKEAYGILMLARATDASVTLTIDDTQCNGSARKISYVKY